jgi:hypothetical protein
VREEKILMPKWIFTAYSWVMVVLGVAMGWIIWGHR